MLHTGPIEADHRTVGAVKSLKSCESVWWLMGCGFAGGWYNFLDSRGSFVSFHVIATGSSYSISLRGIVLVMFRRLISRRHKRELIF